MFTKGHFILYNGCRDDCASDRVKCRALIQLAGQVGQPLEDQVPCKQPIALL